MSDHPPWRWLTVFALAIAWPAPAYANVGVPMLVVIWPAAWLLFIPVCVIEAYVAKRLLALPFAQCVKLSLSANAWSTLVGIPLTWLALLLIEVVFSFGLSISKVDLAPFWPFLAPFFAPWIGPTTSSWHIFAAAAFLCIPFMLVSVRVERWSAEMRVPREQAQRWAWRANLVTYTPIFAGLIAMAIVSYLRTEVKGASQ